MKINNIFKNKEYYMLFILYVISMFGIFIVYICRKYSKFICNKIDECLITYNSDITDFITKNRGINYNNSIYLKDCILTNWHLSHLLLYIFIGFFCPNLFLLSFSIGVTWEILEYFIGHHDFTDIIFNTIGFFIGYLLNKLFI